MTNRRSDATLSWGLVSIIGLILFSLCFARLFFGADLDDEALYVGLPWRFAHGVRAYVDEKCLTQVSAGWLLMPFFQLFKQVRGTSDGIIFFARALSLVFRCGAGAVVFFVLRDLLNGPAALAIALLPIAFVPLNIPSCSYNTLSALFFTLGACLAYRASRAPNEPSANQRALILAAGLCMGLAAFAYPPLLPLGFALGLLLWWERGCDWPAAGWYLLGLSLCLAAFLIAFRLSDIRSAIIYTENTGYSHTRASWLSGVPIEVLKRLPKRFFVLLLGLMLASRKWRWIALPLILFDLVGVHLHAVAQWHTNRAMVLLFLLGLSGLVICPLIDQAAQRRKLMVYLWLPSFLAGWIISFSSNNGAVQMGLGWLPGAIATLVIAGVVLSRLGRLPALISLIILLPAASLVYFQKDCYQDGSITRLRHRVAGGPYHWLLVSDDKRVLLEELGADPLLQQPASGDGATKMLFYPRLPAGYLIAGREPASESMWNCNGKCLQSLRDGTSEAARIVYFKRGCTVKTFVCVCDQLSANGFCRYDLVESDLLSAGYRPKADRGLYVVYEKPALRPTLGRP